MPKFQHFELREFVRSSVAAEKGIDNTPTFEVVDRLELLIANLLEPLREAWGSGLRVSSGYRCEALNIAVGGSTTSAHKRGDAADIVPTNGKVAEFIRWAPRWLAQNGFRWDQLIDESDAAGNRWLHVGAYSSTGAQRGQVIKMTKR